MDSILLLLANIKRFFLIFNFVPGNCRELMRSDKDFMCRKIEYGQNFWIMLHPPTPRLRMSISTFSFRMNVVRRYTGKSSRPRKTIRKSHVRRLRGGTLLFNKLKMTSGACPWRQSDYRRRVTPRKPVTMTALMTHSAHSADSGQQTNAAK